MKAVQKGIVRRVVLLMALTAVLMTACAGVKKEQEPEGNTPKEAANAMMEELKELDLAAFNACTDNYVRTYHNWIGIPTEREYRVFNELQQPGMVKGKQYESNHKFAEKIVEHMEWEIIDVRQEGESAEIDMRITNVNMRNVLGEYEMSILESMLVAPGSGIGQMVREMADLANGKEKLLSIMDELDVTDTWTTEVTVTANREEGRWKMHVSWEFINAFMGNMLAEDYSEELELRIDELMEQNEDKAEEWAAEVEESVEEWTEKVFGR
ncbi:MAG: hypothetical protein K2H52_02895 [Lachnospiraceae bacterium]|nr:hypothetical protein [Lachnospiraceae bacterium]MDE6184136.1 hypothetical protein [Lachnospiraceae bacterium]